MAKIGAWLMFWVIDGSSILCSEDGLPYLLKLSNAPKSAVFLGFIETHQGLVTLHNPDASTPVKYAIDIQTALEIGGIVNYGDGYDSKTEKNLRFIDYRQIGSYIRDQRLLNQISRAIELILWQKNNRFCGQCGKPTHSHSSGEHAKVCSHCKHHAYPKIQPCIIVAITHKNPNTHKTQILLALHHRHKKSGMYGLIAGFIEAGETAEQAVMREVKEEVGIDVENIRYFGSQSWPYPSNLMLGFIADYHSGTICLQDNELLHADFFDLDNLPDIPPKGTIAHQLIQAASKLSD